MPELIDRSEVLRRLCAACYNTGSFACISCVILKIVKETPKVEPEARHGRWIECDYKHLEHGFIETEPNGGLCCSECRAAFQKKKMTYKKYCAACGSKMYADGGTISKERLAEITGGTENG